MATFSSTSSIGNRLWGKRWVIVSRWDGGFFIARRFSKGCKRVWGSCWWLL